MKYRIWDKVNEKYCDDIIVFPNGSLYKEDEWENEYYEIDRCDYIIEQSTGITDINGVELYVGDKVEWINNKYQIIFELGTFALLDKKGEFYKKIDCENDHVLSLFSLGFKSNWEDYCAHNIEKIGTIHDV